MGVWIETILKQMEKAEVDVTPYVGVWIETQCKPLHGAKRLSLLMWECGLKRVDTINNVVVAEVTPYVGVWIETSARLTCHYTAVSLLMWECGLKRAVCLPLMTCSRHSLCGSVD